MLIEIILLEGRSDTQKKRLFEEVTTAVHTSLGMDPKSVRVVIQETSWHHFAVGGVPKAPFPASA